MVDFEKLKKLRAETGISFALCKKALLETKNSIACAKQLLTDWGAETAEDKKTRTISQGIIASYVHHNKKIASLVELMCETDFVAKNAEFQKLATELSLQAASVAVSSVQAFLKSEYIRDPSITVHDLVQQSVQKFGENIQVTRVLRWELGMK